MVSHYIHLDDKCITNLAMSLEIIPLAALCPPPPYIFFRLVQQKGGGYNAARGLISRDISILEKKIERNISNQFIPFLRKITVFLKFSLIKSYLIFAKIKHIEYLHSICISFIILIFTTFRFFPNRFFFIQDLFSIYKEQK